MTCKRRLAVIGLFVVLVCIGVGLALALCRHLGELESNDLETPAGHFLCESRHELESMPARTVR